MRLLVVDQKKLLLGVIECYLTSLGYIVDTAPDSTYARKLVANNCYGLMVLDLMNIHDYGIGLLRLFLKKNPRSPVIVLTSMGYDNELLQTAFKNGAASSLSKTMPIEALSQMIAQYHGKAQMAG